MRYKGTKRKPNETKKLVYSKNNQLENKTTQTWEEIEKQFTQDQNTAIRTEKQKTTNTNDMKYKRRQPTNGDIKEQQLTKQQNIREKIKK